MTLSDTGLSSFAFGLASASGAILAVSAAVWIFVFDRRSREEVDAFGRVRSNASALYDFMVSQRCAKGNYVVALNTYESFARTVAAISRPHSVENIPDYISWRLSTKEVAQASRALAQRVQKAAQQVLSGDQPSLPDPFTLEFHTPFVDLMQRVDLAIQELDWATGVRKVGRTSVEATLGMTIAVLLGSLMAGLGTQIESASGIDDAVNIFVASLLTAGVVGMCGFLIWAFNSNSMSREDWIRKREKQARKKYGGPIPLDG